MGISFHAACALLALAPGGSAVQDAAQARPARAPVQDTRDAGRGSRATTPGRKHRGAEADTRNLESAPSDKRRDSLDRWRRLSPEQQARLRKRFEQLRSLDEHQRRDVEDRASRMRRLADNLVQGLSDSERKRMRALEPERRAQILLEMVEEEARQVGKRVHDKLPAEVRARLEGASPEDRARILAELRHRQRAHESPQALERLGRHLHVPEADVNRWMTLPPDERMQKLLDLGRRAIHRRMEEAEPGAELELNREDWQRIRNLPPEEFHAALLRMGHSLMRRGPDEPPPSWARELGPRQIERLRRVFLENDRPSASDRLELADLPDHERRAELGQRARARALKHIEEEEILPADKIALLRAMPDRQFGEAVRRLMRTGHGAHPPGHPPGSPPAQPRRPGQPREPGQAGHRSQGRHLPGVDPAHPKDPIPPRTGDQRPHPAKPGQKPDGKPEPRPDAPKRPA